MRKEERLISEVKLGPGGIRTIEFFVQYQQICFGKNFPEIISGNSLFTLGKLFQYQIITNNYYELLTKSYIFLRRIEHILQLQGLQQKHILPRTEEELEKLAKRMGFESKMGISALNHFRNRYRNIMLTLIELSSTLFEYDTNLPQAFTKNTNEKEKP